MSAWSWWQLALLCFGGACIGGLAMIGVMRWLYVRAMARAFGWRL